MPIIRSASKRMRQERKRRERNRQTKQQVKTETKALFRALDAGNAKQAAEQLKSAQSELSKAVKKRVLHKNTAARRLSRLNRLVKGMKSAKPVAAARKPAAARPKKTTAKKTAK
jgi:small subunit ribosomal protein S20